ncbi:MAG TPA: CBS domain-containing protein [Polyangiaceae bacterium]
MKAKQELVSRLMSTPVVSIEPWMPVGEALKLAEQLQIHHFPIVEEDRLFGVVCTCDLADAAPEQAVSQFAHRDAVTVTPHSSLGDAAAKMIAHGVGSVVVADAEGVWGILTRDDLAATAPGLLPKILCTVCGSRQHLHRRQSGSYLCRACESRANADAVRLATE